MKRALIAMGLLAIVTVLLAAPVPTRADDPELPKLDDGRVIMNWADFEKILKELLKQPPKEPEPPELPPEPPVEYSLRSASFNVFIGKGFARVEAEYSLDVLKDKMWVSVPVGRSGSGISGVMIDGKPALVDGRSGMVQVLLLGKASHRMQVTYTVAAPQHPGPNSFEVPVASTPGAKINLTAPAELSEITIRGAVITGSSGRGESQNIEAVSGATDSLGIGYNVPVPEAVAVTQEKIPPKIYSNMELLVSVADEVISANAVFNYDIKHSPLSSFTVAVPEGYDVVNVVGQGVSGWKMDDGKVSVSVNYEVQGPYTLQVQMESKREKASGTVNIPEPKTLDVEREWGFVALETRSSLEVTVDSLENLSMIDSTELPPSLRGRAKYPILYSFRFGRHPYSGVLSVVRHGEIEVLTAAIDTVNLVTLFTEDGKSVTRMVYEVRNNKKQYLKVDLPPKAEVWSAYLDDEPIKPSLNDQGQVLVPLKKSGAGDNKVSFTVELIYYAPIEEMKKGGKLKFSFPKADIPASEMLVTLYLPPKYKYKDFEGDLEETEPQIVGITTEISAGEISAPSPAIAGKKKPSAQLYSNRALERQSKMEQEVVDELHDMKALGYMGDEEMGGAQQVQTAIPGTSGPSDKPRRTGMLPVKFNVPLRGKVKRLSKLLVMDEAPEITFNYKKIRKPLPWNKIKLGAKIGGGVIALLIIIIIISRRRRKPSV